MSSSFQSSIFSDIFIYVYHILFTYIFSPMFFPLIAPLPWRSWTAPSAPVSPGRGRRCAATASAPWPGPRPPGGSGPHWNLRWPGEAWAETWVTWYENGDFTNKTGEIWLIWRYQLHGHWRPTNLSWWIKHGWKWQLNGRNHHELKLKWTPRYITHGSKLAIP